jgi:hypothetical protein
MAAQNLKRPVLPWLLDKTDLPKLVEIQGIKEQELQEVLERLRPRLGMQLRWRRLLQTAAMLVVVAAGTWGYVWVHRPWVMKGEVLSNVNDETGLEGVSVELTTVNEHYYAISQGKEGCFAIAVPRRGVGWPEPLPRTVELIFRKDGYKTVKVPDASTSGRFKAFLTPNEN